MSFSWERINVLICFSNRIRIMVDNTNAAAATANESEINSEYH